MGLILGIIAAIGTLAVVAMIVIANGMSDAPSQQSASVWPALIIGTMISVALIGSHYFPISW